MEGEMKERLPRSQNPSQNAPQTRHHQGQGSFAIGWVSGIEQRVIWRDSHATVSEEYRLRYVSAGRWLCENIPTKRLISVPRLQVEAEAARFDDMVEKIKHAAKYI